MIVTIVDQAIQGRPRCDHYARPLIELLRTFCLWIDRTYLNIRQAENGGVRGNVREKRCGERIFFVVWAAG